MLDLSREQKLEMIMLLEEKARRKHVYRYREMYGTMYDWQLEFIGTTQTYMSSCLCAANRIGKTYL